VIEELSIGNMTASANGTVDKPGKNIKQKVGLKRAILGTAPGSFVKCPVRQSGRSWMPGDLVGHAAVSVVADVPELRPCPQKSLVRTRASLWLRIRGGARSKAAALSILVDGLELLGREPAWAARLETPSRAA
jgi:hypothetical protein